MIWNLGPKAELFEETDSSLDILIHAFFLRTVNLNALYAVAAVLLCLGNMQHMAPSVDHL